MHFTRVFCLCGFGGYCLFGYLLWVLVSGLVILGFDFLGFWFLGFEFSGVFALGLILVFSFACCVFLTVSLILWL